MTRTLFPIAPSVLKWARERAGFSVAELSANFRDYADWEIGKGGPSYPQLEALGDRLKIPVAVFFFPEPPETSPIEETFRTLPDTVLHKLPSKVRLLLRKAKAFQLNVNELCGGENPAKRLITRDLRLSALGPAEATAAEVRDYVGIDVDVQTSWASDDEALKNWRDRLQSVGVFVFKDAFEAPDFFGFCLTDPEFPIIYLNNSSTRTRQIFTLFHELAHLLFGTSGIDSKQHLATNSEQSERIEVACNAFAAEFLLPAKIFAEAARGRQADEQTATALARHFHVSRESVYRRFLDRNEVTRSAYETAAKRWAAESKSSGSGGNYYRTKLTYLGRPYVGLALKAFKQDRISERELAQYLDIAPKSLSSLEEYYVSGGAA